MKNKYLAEGVILKQAHLPVDLNLAAVAGERISLEKADRMAIMISFGDSTGAAVDVTLRQHDAATAGNSKDLAVANNYYHKADTAVKFTKVEPAAAAAAYDLAGIFGDAEGIVVFEVLGEDLDVNGGFDHVSVEFGAAGAAKLVSTVYCGHIAKKLPAYEEEV